MGNVRKRRLSLQHGESMREFANTGGDMKEKGTTYLCQRKTLRTDDTDSLVSEDSRAVGKERLSR